ncbi:MAG: hypothetical protein UW73_C0017G0015 [Microgenomates group bacterium GW2011_GWB1_44_8]|nr:MAG: hypothetical protein UW73_C0017G0015 [Microgenomates group bacterium GW2011_GWB1_44_8]
MKTYILDASFILGALLRRDNRAAVRMAVIFKESADGKATIISSPLLALEIANGLRFTITDQNQAFVVLEKFVELPIKYQTLSGAEIKEMLRLSYELGTTVYDCSYHLLAIIAGGVFITCDKEYYQKAKHLKHLELVA